MPNDYFRFNQFTVNQDRCAMKVGTDGVLLGAWADCKYAVRILDVGTGTGLIALMLAQRSQAEIDAVEIDQAAAWQAVENVTASAWKHRINIFNIDFQYYTKTCCQKYDLIVSNPPFFQNSLKSPLAGRNTARHSDELPFEVLIEGSCRLLAEKGYLAVVLPAAEGEIFQQTAARKGLFCVEKISVVPRPGAVVKRLLMCFTREKQTCRMDEILIETDGRHCYSSQFKELTKEFYLKH